MPRAVVMRESLLLTQSGWAECARDSINLRVVGIDRYGRTSVAPVAVKSLEERKCSVFVGTSLCCGAFSPSSTLQDATGQIHRAADIADSGLIGDLKFETQLACGALSLCTDQVAQVWEALASEVAHADDSRAAIRCRKSLSEGADLIGRFGLLERREGRRYYWIDKDKLDQAGASSTAILDELLQVFQNDDGLGEFGRESLYLPMTIAASWAERNRAYAMSYDTLQHTAVVFLQPDAGVTTSLAAGRCVTSIGEARDEREISWRDALWNPICNGLILVGEQ
ncbi:MAG: hypothetical protein M3N91_17545 [Pseudomonadota bacterium]|nr:hypothetical protein [Pseudomonadota bacterium]